jgi:hypothetical protein
MGELTQNEAVMRLREILHMPGLAHWNEILDITEQHPFLVEYVDSHIVENWPHTLRRSDDLKHPALPLVRFLEVPRDHEETRRVLLDPMLLQNLTMLKMDVPKDSIEEVVGWLASSTTLTKLTHLFLTFEKCTEEHVQMLWDNNLFSSLKYLSLRGIPKSWQDKLQKLPYQTALSGGHYGYGY